MAWPIVVAAVLSLAAVMLRAAIEPLLGHVHEFAPAYAAILAASGLATWRAGVLTAILCAASGEVFGARSPFEDAALREQVAYGVYALVAGVIIVSIHREQRAKRGLAERCRTLQQADAARSELVATIAHELRNPIAAALSALELLKSSAPTHPSALHAIQRQLGYMKRIVCDLFDRARMEQGKIRLDREILGLDRVVDEAIGCAEVWTAARRQNIVRLQPAPAGKLLADPVRLHQALLNLLHNASKFSGEGAAITLQISESPDTVCFSVRDSGVGMTPAEAATVFDPYVQGGTSRHGEPGLGLGLALTKHLVQLHGGTIEAHSRGAGLGSEFTIRLPRGCTGTAPEPQAEARQSSTPARAHAGRPAGAALRLLVVDDNPDAAETLAELLRTRGHQVTTALDGRSAIESAARETPDLVFVDIELQDISGHEVAKALRDFRRAPPIVALSGYPREAGPGWASPAEFDRYLTKPVTLEDIDAALEAALPPQGSSDEPPPSPPAPPRAPAGRGACAGKRPGARQGGERIERFAPKVVRHAWRAGEARGAIQHCGPGDAGVPDASSRRLGEEDAKTIRRDRLWWPT